MVLTEDPAEASLIASARGGDRRAFDLLLRPHRDRLWGVCVRITGNAADAEDAVQECLVAIWRGLGTFRGDAGFSTWTYRIAANAALGILRKRRELTIEFDDIIDDRRSFEDDLADRDMVGAALRSLPEAFRVALVLREFGGLTYDEIARHQGIPVQTVKSRINRARTAVRAAVGEDFRGRDG